MTTIFHAFFIVSSFTFFESNLINSVNNKNEEMKIIIDNQVFDAMLYDNATSEKFKGLLPMTLVMKELNNNEKYADIPGKLSTKPTIPGNIEEGDLMIYDTNTLVLFYKSFRTNYKYTKIGKINNPASLASALGKKDITISFELK